MATNELQAKITADISGLESGLKKAQKLQSDYAKSISNTQKDIADNIAISKQYEKAIDQLNKELKDGTISQKDFQKQLKRIRRDEKETKVETANLRKELSRLKRDQKDLAATSTTASKGMQKVGKSTANATPTVIEFSGVIQDASYDIQGVANIIQKLTTNFGYLKKSAGGTVPALKALAGSFSGPAGIVFAVSAVTSLLVQYGSEIFSAIGATDKLTKKTAEYVGEANNEIRTLGVLLDIAKNESNTKEVRLRAINEINDKYGDYLGNLDLESIKTDAVTKSVNSLVKALILEAKLKGVKATIEESTKDRTEDLINADLARTKALGQLNGQVNKAIRSNSLLNTKLGGITAQEARTKAFLELTKANGLFGDAARQAGAGVKVASTSLAEAESEIQSINKEIDKSIGKFLKLEKSLTTQLFEKQEGADIDSNFDGPVVTITYDKSENDKRTQKELDRLKKIAEKRAGVDLSIASELVPEGGGTIESYIDLKRDEFGKVVRDRFGKAIKTNVDVGLELEDIPEFKLPKVNTGEYAQSLLDAQAAAKSFQEVTTPVFSAVASEIGKTFQTNSEIVNAAINSIISAGAKMLQQLIIQTVVGDGVKDASATKDIVRSQAATTGNAVKAASETASAAGPASAFLLPVLIGAAIGFVAATFAGIKFAHGGIVPGGSFTGDKIPAMLNSGEMVLNAGQQKNLFDILNNNLSSLQNRSSDNSNLIATTVLRGSDLYLTIEREKRKR